MTEPKITRCAIYTRKSSADGLEQDFNSLDAQREACEAYIASQRQEGWKLLPEHYDDGGKSGGTLARPALERLLEDIEAGKVDLVVVYKIDRLTRSLADFAKLVDRLDKAGTSFVSVTQAFNTSTSMGRLTLNVLLSFAQFEREVTAERIRDKLAQSKAKGLWMGGYIPLGYTPNGRTLTIIPAEARTIRRIFTLYDELQCLRRVEMAAHAEGLLTKTREADDPKMRGGKAFSRGRLQSILRNPLYIGLIRHKEKTYPGQHDPIIETALYDRVQEKLDVAGRRASKNRTAKITSALAGKVFDEKGERLTPSHTTRGARRFRYYVSYRLIKHSGDKDMDGLRLPATTLEEAAAAAVSAHLAKNLTTLAGPDDASIADITRHTKNLEALAKASIPQRLAAIESLIVAPGQLTITLALPASDVESGPPDATPAPTTTFSAAFTHRRRGVEAKLVMADTCPAPDRLLQRTLGKALGWLDDINAGIRVEALAERENISGRYLRARLQMAFLSPRIQKAILEGTQPAHLSTETFVRMDIPMEWSKQEPALGFATPAP